MSDAARLTYLDNNATTRVAPAVLEAMRPFWEDQYANAASPHRFGAYAAARVEEARAAVARLLQSRDSEIVFTSGGTEADNAALRGVLAARPDRRHLVISAVEHHAVLTPAELLESEGISVTRVGIDARGRLDLDALDRALRPDTALVSIMLANNETGVVFPLAEIARRAKAVGAVVHADAVNAVGKIVVHVEELGVDLLSISAHKLHGPKGVGALYVRRGTRWRPTIVGGPQERERRGGTSNVPGIVGFGAACALLCEAEHAPEGPTATRIRALRDRLETEITLCVPGARVIARDEPRLPNTSCICFEGVGAEALILLLSEAGICVSSGAACSSGSLEPSHVLKAMAIPPEIAQGQVRFSLSRFSSEADVRHVLEVLPEAVRRVAAVSL